MPDSAPKVPRTVQSIRDRENAGDISGSLPHLIGLAALLFITCHLVWNVGLMHTDDAEWALAAVDPNSHPVRDFAVSQGRLWAWPIGGMMLYALRWSGTIYGEVLKLGSFAVFFFAFQSLVIVYCGRSIALISSYIFIGLLAIRWDGSILTAYPLLVWPSGTLLILSIFLARAYWRSGQMILLVPAAFTLFLSLFENEGITIAFIALFAAALIANEFEHDGPRRSAATVRVQPRRIHLWSIWIGSVVLYAILASLWAHRHPSHYDGHTFAKLNVLAITRILFHFSTDGSVLHDILSPYSVTFGDAVTQKGYVSRYDILSSLYSGLARPAALMVGLIACVMIYVTVRQIHRIPGDRRAIRQVINGVSIGSIIMMVPMLPVAMLEKYQNWFFHSGVRAYNGTILAHFGDSLLLAVFSVSFLERVQHRTRQVIGIVLAGAIGVLSMLGYSTNADLVSDMRHEGSRWRIFNDAVSLAASSGMSVQTVWAPRFATGSWFTVVPDSYWSQWAASRLQSRMALKSKSFNIQDVSAGAALLDYHLFDDSVNAIITLSHIDPRSADAGRLAVDAIAVKLDDVSTRSLNHTYLNYTNLSGEVFQTSLADLTQIAGHPEMRLLSGLTARPEGIAILDQSTITKLSIDCPVPLSDAVDLKFGTSASGRHTTCNAMPMLGSGWWTPEPAGVWSIGPLADLTLPAMADHGTPLYLDVNASTYTGMGFSKGHQIVDVYVKDTLVATWDFSNDGVVPSTSLVIPSQLRDPNGGVHLAFKIDHPIAPSSLADTADNRALGLLLCGIKLNPTAVEDGQRISRGCRLDDKD